jgi:hypothetical protein
MGECTKQHSKCYEIAVEEREGLPEEMIFQTCVEG